MFTGLNEWIELLQNFKQTYNYLFYIIIAILIISIIVLFAVANITSEANKTNEKINDLNKEIELLKVKCDDTNKLIYRLLEKKKKDDLENLDVKNIIESVKNN